MRRILSTAERINTIVSGQVIHLLRKYLDINNAIQKHPNILFRRSLTDSRLVNIALELVNKDRYRFDGGERSTLENLAELALDNISFMGHLRREILKLSSGEVWLIESLNPRLDSFRGSHSVCPYTRNIYGVD